MTAPRVFHPLVLRVALVTLIPAGVGVWVGGWWVGAATALVLLAMELRRVRRAVLSGMPAAVEFQPTRPADHPWLDDEGFRSELAALQSLGFLPIADYRVAYPGAPDGFARVLVHPGHRVYAEVNQLRKGAVQTPVATALQSVMDDGWSLQTSSQEPFAVTAALVRPRRSVWRSRPGAAPADLLDDHLALRERMCRDLGIRVGGEGTVDGWFAVQRDGHREQADALRRVNIVMGILRGLRCERSARTEWMGDYSRSASA
jgi:hypothetical protein